MTRKRLLDTRPGTLPPGLPLPEQLLTTLPAHRPRQLASEIAALREALQCITGDGEAVIYGRIDSLINERQQELLAIYAAALRDGEDRQHEAAAA